MRDFAVVIPSCNDEYLRGCIESLVTVHPHLEPERIVVVSDGLTLKTRWRLRGVTWVNGESPFIFSRAVNQGARACAGLDFLIVGHDVRFRNLNDLQRLADESEGAAAIAPAVNGVCGQSMQRAGGTALEAPWLCFICIYIPRAAWDAVGELDERFVGYGYDDVDWSLRAESFGPMRVSRSVTIDHIEPSTFRSAPQIQELYAQNRQLFEQKWGHDEKRIVRVSA